MGIWINSLIVHVHDILKEKQFNNIPMLKFWDCEKTQTNLQPFNALTKAKIMEPDKTDLVKGLSALPLQAPIFKGFITQQ